MQTVYAVKENKEVLVYKDYDLDQFLCKFTADDSNKPTRRNKKVTINCMPYNLEWVN